jgi:hypothetical protein
MLLLVGAAPAEQVIPFPGVDGEALIIPTDSPVRFAGFIKDGKEYIGARFKGRFVLTGSFTWGCYVDCGEPTVTEAENFALTVVPDPALAARLPHWKLHDNDIAIGVSKARTFTHAITTPAERAELVSGRLPEIKGRIAIVVDHFVTSLDCDSANFGADFVAVAKPAKLANVNLNGNYGCG